MLLKAATSIFKDNLGVKKTERVLLFTDRPAPKEVLSAEDTRRRECLGDMANLISDIGKNLCGKLITFEYRATGSHGKEPPKGVWELAFGARTIRALEEAGLMRGMLAKRIGAEGLLKAEGIIRKRAANSVDAVVALSNYSTSHTNFRNFLTRLCGTRYASMPLFDMPMLEGAMNVDYKALARRTRAMAVEVNRAVEIEVETPDGTHIRFSTEGRKAHADTGILTKAGAFGNLPAGEVYLAPLEGTAEGQLVLKWAPTRELSSPVTLTVKDGLVKGISGHEPFVIELEKKLSERKENRNIAELGIGTNDRATRPDNVLESEKILGTVHIALGDNFSFGGVVKAPFHQDFVFFRPTVTLIDRQGGRTRLLEEGKLRETP